VCNDRALKVLPLFAASYISVRMGVSALWSSQVITECWRLGGALNRVFAVLGLGLNAGSFLWALSLVRCECMAVCPIFVGTSELPTSQMIRVVRIFTPWQYCTYNVHGADVRRTYWPSKRFEALKSPEH